MAQRIRHGVRDRSADPSRARLACALHSKRIQRRRRVLCDEHLHVRHLLRGGKQVVHEAGRQWLASCVIGELLQQGATDPLREAAHDLSLHQGRVDDPSDVVGHGVSMHVHRACFGIDLDSGEVDTVGEPEELTYEPVLDLEHAVVSAQQLFERDGARGRTRDRHAA